MPYKRPGSTASPFLQRSQYDQSRARQSGGSGGSYQTQDTIPLSHPPFAKNNAPSSPARSSSPYVTQPTQPLIHPGLGKRKRTESPERSQSSIVQVPASSPLRQETTYSGIQPAGNGIKPGPVARGGYNNGFSNFANSIAPPGTAYRPPIPQPTYRPSIPQPREAQMISTQDLGHEHDEAIIDSSDDDTNNGDIPQARLGGNSNRPQGGIMNVIAQYTHQEPPRPKTNDGMVAGYTSSRPPRPNPAKSAPAKAKAREISINQVDWILRPKVQQLMGMFPGVSIATLDDVLRRSQGSVEVAQMDLYDRQEREVRDKVIDMTNSEGEDELSALPVPQSTSLPQSTSFKRPGTKPTTKVEADNKRSIMSKYTGKFSVAQSPPAARKVEAIPISSSPVKVATPPQPVRRRLVQGRRGRSPTPPSSPAIAPPPVAAPPTRVAARNASKRLVESDEEDEDEEPEAQETDDEESVEQDEAIDLTAEEDDTLEARLLQQLNTCTVGELVDLSTQPREVAKAVLEHRPFTSLDDVREISVETTLTTRAGKTRTIKKKIGDRLVDVCLEMSSGYEAVDQLVTHCESISKSISTEMKNMGMDIAALQASGAGELSFTDVDVDSGIGTPCSSIADEDSVRSSSRRTLSQPSNMNKDIVMKDYQIAGLNWMALMWRLRLSCILADDMGLGKTCQVISFVSYLIGIGQKGPHLVVVPGSTLENWLREFKRFAPSIEVIPYYGSQKERGELREIITRRLDDEDDDLSTVVTTYETAKNKEDNHFLRQLKPTLCVFDEGHYLKNSTSARYTELMRIPAVMRLLLTGTPLQNNLQELISLLSFIMPKVFREHSEELALLFKHKARVTETDASSQEALLSQERILRARSMMTPFVLRRKKAQVLKHIPAKTTRVEYCDMTDDQAEVYNSEIAEVKRIIQERAAAKAAGDKKPTWTVKGNTNKLMALRLAAIHPLLRRYKYTDKVLDKMVSKCKNLEEFNQLTKDREKRIFEMFSAYSDFELHQFSQIHSVVRKLDQFPDEEAAILNSGKVAKLLSLLLEHRTEGSRTLVFSKFTKTLDILELVLNTHGLRFCRLDGSTQIAERQELIDKFYDDEDISVFMLSTGAGGAGINLAAANKVIIFDMSLNPQDDIQAENRAHRVGQTREVEVIRLVTRGTVEEQIYRLGETKLALDERVAGTGTGVAASAPGSRSGTATPMSEIEEAGGEKAEAAGANRVMDMMFEDLEKLEGKDGGDEAKVEEKADAKSTDVMVKEKNVKVKDEEEEKDVDMKDAYAAELKKAGLDVAL